MSAARNASAFIDKLDAGVKNRIEELSEHHLSVCRANDEAARSFPNAGRELTSSIQAALPAASSEYRRARALLEKGDKVVDRCRSAKQRNEQSLDLIRAVQSTDYVDLLSAAPLDEDAGDAMDTGD